MDSDSFKVGIKNHASATIYNRSSHFVGTITTVKGGVVKGFVGVIQVKDGGTIVWKIEYDY